MNLSYIRKTVSSQDARQELFDDGLNVAIDFIIQKESEDDKNGEGVVEAEEEKEEEEKEKEGS